jgi:hypothetical protein
MALGQIHHSIIFNFIKQELEVNGVFQACPFGQHTDLHTQQMNLRRFQAIDWIAG